MKIIVLSIAPYKEKDAIVESISEQGLITFLAKGIFDPKNANAAINNVLSVADIELNEGDYKYPVLKSATNVVNSMKTVSEFDYLSSLLLIAEATKVLLQDDEKERIFNSLLTTLETLKTTKEPLKILVVYYAALFRISGYEFEVNHCVFCGTKQGIKAFSFADGGFVCQNCLNEEMICELNNKQMLLLRAAVLCKDISQFKFDCDRDDVVVLLNKFFEFIYDYYGIQLKNASLIIK